MNHAEIDYGYGTAHLWGDFTEATVKRCFMQHANQCFGIRKSISDFQLIKLDDETMPTPWSQLPGATTMLKHSGDTIVWDAAGEKIKSEWD